MREVNSVLRGGETKAKNTVTDAGLWLLPDVAATWMWAKLHSYSIDGLTSFMSRGTVCADNAQHLNRTRLLQYLNRLIHAGIT